MKPRIISIACSSGSITAVSEKGEVYVWGERMGVYPPFEMTKGSLGEIKEIN